MDLDLQFFSGKTFSLRGARRERRRQLLLLLRLRGRVCRETSAPLSCQSRHRNMDLRDNDDGVMIGGTIHSEHSFSRKKMARKQAGKYRAADFPRGERERE